MKKGLLNRRTIRGYTYLMQRKPECNQLESWVQRWTLVALWILAGGLLTAQTPTLFLGDTPGAPTPCNCLNNADNGQGGQFSQTISITGPSGQNWTISSATNLFIAASPPPPGTPIPVAGGTVVPEVSPGLYQYTAIHLDGLGFNVTVSDGMGTVLQADNTCYYPDLNFVGLPDTVCLTSLPVPLQASANGATGTGSFTINGNAATVFNAQNMGVGSFEVVYTFDAGAASPNDPGDPGCVSSIRQQVVVPPQPSLAVNALVNVTFGQNCLATIVPDMVIEGTYPCFDDFVITVFDQQGMPIGNMVDGTYAGQTLQVQVMSVAGQFIGNGAIFFSDESDPTLTCPVSDNLADIPEQIQFINGILNTADPNFNPNNFACFDPVVAPVSGLHFYQLDTFRVSATDTYSFELNSSMTGGGAFALYQGTFNAFGGPCQNIVGVGEPIPDGEGFYHTQTGTPGISAMLMAGELYTILTTSFNGNTQGAFNYAIYSAGNGRVLDVPLTNGMVMLPFFCSSTADLLNNQASLAITGSPTVNDNCNTPVSVTFTDVVTNPGLCGTAVLERTFTATDQSGNDAQCVQMIEIPPVSIDRVQLPPKNVMLECNTPFATLPNGNPAPNETGFPFVQTAFGVFTIDPAYCNILGNFQDQGTVFSCNGNSQFIRRWTIFDNCNANDIIFYDQLIQIVDRTPPTIVCNAPDLNLDGLADTLLYSTGSEGCFATFLVPQAQVSDNCGSFVVLTEIVTEQITEITNTFGFVISIDTQTVVLATVTNNNFLVTNIPQGDHSIRYTAIDDCNNTSTLLCPIRVLDFTSPTAVCDDDLSLSLNNLGVGTLQAIDVDEGSSDNCGIVLYEIRRKFDFDINTCLSVPEFFTDWGPTVNFYCCEVGQIMTVELRVTDASGNTNTCMTDITIGDSTPPTCIAPTPVIIDCADLPNLFVADSIAQLTDLFGAAQAVEGCGDALLSELAPIVDLDDCGAGLIRRRFRATDFSGNVSTNSCEQIISIIPATSYEIKFPKDIIGECGDGQADTLMINSLGCESFARSVTDEYFTVETGLACFKILRTYSVINWCEYDGFSNAVELTRDEDCDAVSGEEDVWVIRRPTTTFIDADDDPTNNLPFAGQKGQSCDGTTNPAGYWRTVSSTGYWKYTQVIKVFDNVAPTIVAPTPDTFCSQDEVNCTGEVTVEVNIQDDCQVDDMIVMAWFDANNDGSLDEDITLTALSGQQPQYTISGTFPLGSHSFRIRAEDRCHNVTQTVIPFTIVDCQLTLPALRTSIQLDLQALAPNTDADGDGDIDLAAATLAANSFVINPNDSDCSGALRYSIYRAADVLSGAVVPDPSDDAIVLTCDDLGTVELRVYVWDNAQNAYLLQPDGSLGGPNYAFAQAFSVVLDGTGVCTGGNIQTAMVSGTIITEEGETVSEVGIQLAPEEAPMMTTSVNGQYAFELDMYEDYDIIPQGINDWDNGVSTFDIILIAKHILGTQLLDSPYKIIAADINRSNSVSTIDLIYLRKMVLGIADDFPSNTSWRFVDANYTFPNPLDPWQTDFPEHIFLPDLDHDMNSGDFIGVKIGDVNLTAQANYQQDEVEERSTQTRYLHTQEQAYTAGDELIVSLTAAELELLGFQFTLAYDASLVLEEVIPGLLHTDHLYAHPTENILTGSWHQEEPKVAEGEVYFSLRFTALTDGRLSDKLVLGSQRTRAEAYTHISGPIDPLGIQFTLPTDTASDFYLEQNRPNPFGEQTVIGFHLPSQGMARFTVFNTDGRVLWEQEQFFAAGYQTILFDARLIDAKGVLYYKLETGPHTATRKMVLF